MSHAQTDLTGHPAFLAVGCLVGQMILVCSQVNVTALRQDAALRRCQPGKLSQPVFCLGVTLEQSEIIAKHDDRIKDAQA